MKGVFDIAGVIIEISYNYRYTQKLFEGYEYKGENTPSATIVVSDEELEKECKLHPEEPVFYLENLAILRKVMRLLVTKHQAILFHGSSIKYKDKAYVFTAVSGTGKSTHTRLLKEYLGDSVEFINDDKPILKLVDGTVYCYGSPWNGKHHVGNNVSAPLKAVCIVNRAKDNSITKIPPEIAMKTLFEQSMEFSDEDTAINVLNVISKIMAQASFYNLNCNMDLSAAECSYRGMIYED